MDNAVALVQAYLQVNGYLTVSEYPILELTARGEYQAATDIDILAFRFPGVARLIPIGNGRNGRDYAVHAIDPELRAPIDQPDMIVGEVKEGKARINEAARDIDVLQAALARFGCCSGEDARDVARRLLRAGQTSTPCGHRLRMLIFASIESDRDTYSCQVISLGHVAGYLRDYLRKHWEALRHLQLKDPALGFLATLEKATERANRMYPDPTLGARGNGHANSRL